MDSFDKLLLIVVILTVAMIIDYARATPAPDPEPAPPALHQSYQFYPLGPVSSIPTYRL